MNYKATSNPKSNQTAHNRMKKIRSALKELLKTMKQDDDEFLDRFPNMLIPFLPNPNIGNERYKRRNLMSYKATDGIWLIHLIGESGKDFGPQNTGRRSIFHTEKSVIDRAHVSCVRPEKYISVNSMKDCRTALENAKEAIRDNLKMYQYKNEQILLESFQEIEKVLATYPE